MNVAIVLSGNLRTFLMPTRENPGKRLCDGFMEDIVLNNNADVFAFTDTNDFYYNGTQFYTTNQIEILNNDAFRINNKIDFLDNESARQIITEQIKLLGNNLKGLHIENPFKAPDDPKFDSLTAANVGGSSPTLLIHQFRKLNLVYDMLKSYEKENNKTYDIIVKWRFDISNHGKILFQSYDYVNNDVYVAGDHSPIIYDWHAFGTRKGMDVCLSIYDALGTFLNEGRVYVCNDCKRYPSVCSEHNNSFEVTLAPEYHLFRMLQKHNIRIKNSGYPACPYRYKSTDTIEKVDDIVNKLDINATVVSYTASNVVNTQSYTGKK